MNIHKIFQKKHVIFWAIVAGIALSGLSNALLSPSGVADTSYRVHIAFGFHVNLYHSFRGDTNDENGFGQDIRIIRHTISELDRFNKEGIPVSAVWDFDNLFSLEELLPVHAPDIIRDIQRRVRENTDDVILMSYNNGMVSAMNHREFMVSMERAITNEKGSGVRDLFGRVSPIVRPQEMMTTPGNFERYRSLGIRYASLYYSATPFDAFRVFSRELSAAEAHNPIHFRNPESGEQIVIIPTYHAGDLVEHVSLRSWAEKLHGMQAEGKIDRDVLIFINFDADADFWTGAKIPWYLSWLPNTGGLDQLIESVADLDFVSFTGLNDYLATHRPMGTVHFSQDTADGSFHGYNSWAEKAYASEYWTRIIKNRRAVDTARRIFTNAGYKTMLRELEPLLKRSLETRLRALSTTNFGLATPFLARQREAAMESLLDRLDDHTREIERHISQHADVLIKNAVAPRAPMRGGVLVDAFMHINPDNPAARTGDRMIELILKSEDAGYSRYVMVDAAGRIIPVTGVHRQDRLDGKYAAMTFRVSGDHGMPDGVYFIYGRKKKRPGPAEDQARVYADARVLKNEYISVHFDENGRTLRVTSNGVGRLDAESLFPYMEYHGQRLTPGKLKVDVEKSGEDGVAVVRIHGVWNGPKGKTRAPGWVDYRLRLMGGIPYLFVNGRVRYPDTYRQDVIQKEKPMLARRIDRRWEAVAPLELRFSPRARTDAPFFIHKRNFLGKEAAYPVDYFRHSPKNLNVASINNHITAEYAGVTTSGSGMAVAMNTGVNANFAFCPFRMEYARDSGELSIRANPFGTYHGSQILPPTSGNRQGFEAVTLCAPQLHSAGPTYNGYEDRFELMIAFFEGDAIPDDVKNDLIAFARRPMTIGTIKSANHDPKAPPHLPPAGFLALPHGDGMIFHWEETGVPGTKYRIRFRFSSDSKEKVMVTDKNPLFVEMPGASHTDEEIIAAIQAIGPGGDMGALSPEIRCALVRETGPELIIPLDFKAKVLWANISTWIQRKLL